MRVREERRGGKGEREERREMEEELKGMGGWESYMVGRKVSIIAKYLQYSPAPSFRPYNSTSFSLPMINACHSLQ